MEGFHGLQWYLMAGIVVTALSIWGLGGWDEFYVEMNEGTELVPLSSNTIVLITLFFMIVGWLPFWAWAIGKWLKVITPVLWRLYRRWANRGFRPAPRFRHNY